MQVDLKLTAVVYEATAGIDGEGMYKIKVHYNPLDIYLDYKFILFKSHTGQYELYPGSIKDKYSEKWKDKFEYSKKSHFHLYLLDEVIDTVESYAGIAITRTHRNKGEPSNEEFTDEPDLSDPSEYLFWLKKKGKATN